HLRRARNGDDAGDASLHVEQRTAQEIILGEGHVRLDEAVEDLTAEVAIEPRYVPPERRAAEAEDAADGANRFAQLHGIPGERQERPRPRLANFEQGNSRSVVDANNVSLLSALAIDTYLNALLRICNASLRRDRISIGRDQHAGGLLLCGDADDGGPNVSNDP